MSDRLEDLCLKVRASTNDKWFDKAKAELQSYIDTKVIEGRLEEAGLFKQYFRGRTQAYANTRIENLEAELKLKGEKE